MLISSAYTAGFHTRYKGGGGEIFTMAVEPSIRKTAVMLVLLPCLVGMQTRLDFKPLGLEVKMRVSKIQLFWVSIHELLVGV